MDVADPVFGPDAATEDHTASFPTRQETLAATDEGTALSTTEGRPPPAERGGA